MPERPTRIRWQPQPPTHPSAEPPSPAAAHPPTPNLERFGRDLTQLAREGRLRPLFGRQKELLQLQRILLRKEKNTPLLVGAAGVGKTALVEGLASAILRGEVAPDLRRLRVVEISPGALVAGTSLRGSFESRLQALIEEALQDHDLLLFIDEIHTLVHAGAVEGGALDAANLLKPALARRDFRLVGSTTPAEYEKFLRADLAFERRFALLLLDEPSEAEAIEILSALKEDYQRHHALVILPEALEAAVHLSSQHLPERCLPDKALDLLDAACTLVRLPGPEGAGVPAGVVDAAAVQHSLAEKLGLPLQKLTQDRRARLAGLAAYLNRRILGQQQAIQRIAAAVQAAFSGLSSAGRPLGVLAFFGSTGVGKTATAKALAEYLFESPDALIRLDMSEYQAAFTVSRLFGSPPGYIGYGDEGTFASRLRRQPHAIVLLDEIEKAHPDVQTAFLQLFDEGRATDARGRLVEARHALFILTSNLFSVGDLADPQDYEAHLAALRASLAGMLRPEFVNRLSEIILFRELAPADLAEIARLELSGLGERLAQQGVRLTVEEAVYAWLGQEAHDGLSGARGLQRLIARSIMQPLSARLVAGPAPAVEVRLVGHLPVVHLTPAPD